MQEARSTLSACASADLKSFSSAVCASVGRTAFSIWSIGKLATPGASPPQAPASTVAAGAAGRAVAGDVTCVNAMMAVMTSAVMGDKAAVLGARSLAINVPEI